MLGSVVTFSGLASEIAAPGAVRRPAHLDRLQRERILERALAGSGFEALREAAGRGRVPAAPPAS